MRFCVQFSNQLQSQAVGWQGLWWAHQIPDEPPLKHVCTGFIQEPTTLSLAADGIYCGSTEAFVFSDQMRWKSANFKEEDLSEREV